MKVQEEMNKILGRINDNGFIKHETESLSAYKKTIALSRKRYLQNKARTAKISEPAG
jgi:hypothetical protein